MILNLLIFFLASFASVYLIFTRKKQYFGLQRIAIHNIVLIFLPSFFASVYLLCTRHKYLRSSSRRKNQSVE